MDKREGEPRKSWHMTFAELRAEQLSEEISAWLSSTEGRFLAFQASGEREAKGSESP